MVFSQQKIIAKTADFTQKRLTGETNGRDWWHVWRVWQNAKTIAASEPKADLFTVELAALLHDFAHWQLTDGDEHHGPQLVMGFLVPLGADTGLVAHVQRIIRDTRYKGAGATPDLASLESKIIHDADKLDSLGAVGIAKTFTYGGSTNRPLHNPMVKPRLHQSLTEYKHGDTTSINHFYEKNLLLKDRMQTRMGKKLAVRRHVFLEKYLEEFYNEWDGKA